MMPAAAPTVTVKLVSAYYNRGYGANCEQYVPGDTVQISTEEAAEMVRCGGAEYVDSRRVAA
jgi:hypothetical protein